MRTFGEQQDEAGRGIAREEFRQRPAERGWTKERNGFARRKDAAANESIPSTGLRSSVLDLARRHGLGRDDDRERARLARHDIVGGPRSMVTNQVAPTLCRC